MIKNEGLLSYALSFSSPEPELLKELHRDTHLKMLHPRMASGHLQGRLLSMISKMIRPTNILEIGTFTGYSAICLTEGLMPGGHLHTIEVNPELEDYITKWISKAGLRDVVTLHIADAGEIIEELSSKISFDMVFLDADKTEYPRYYQMLRKSLKPGAFIIADNVLWDGKVTDESIMTTDPETAGIHAFNKMVLDDPGVGNIIIPVRDGLSLIRIL